MIISADFHLKKWDGKFVKHITIGEIFGATLITLVVDNWMLQQKKLQLV